MARPKKYKTEEERLEAKRAQARKGYAKYRLTEKGKLNEKKDIQNLSLMMQIEKELP